jgi:hypothetical protein
MGTSTYRVYGVTLRSDFDFAVPLPPATDAPDLEFQCRTTPPVDVDWSAVHAVLGAETDPGWSDPFSYFHLDGVDVVRLPEHADYYLFDDRIVCHLLRPEVRYLVDNQLFGTIFALWLEGRGTLAFHASAVVIDDAAVAFVAPPRGGKTSMACAMARAGNDLLTEDLLPVRPLGGDMVADPGYPMVRMWPEQAQWFTGVVDDHPLVHPAFEKRRVRIGDGGFAAFRAEPAPLRRVYLLDRDRSATAPISIELVPPQEALVGLVRASFLPVEVERYGWQPRRLALLGSLLTKLRVLRLRYPSGLDRLPRVVAAVRADLDAAGPHELAPPGVTASNTE